MPLLEPSSFGLTITGCSSVAMPPSSIPEATSTARATGTSGDTETPRDRLVLCRCQRECVRSGEGKPQKLADGSRDRFAAASARTLCDVERKVERAFPQAPRQPAIRNNRHGVDAERRQRCANCADGFGCIILLEGIIWERRFDFHGARIVQQRDLHTHLPQQFFSSEGCCGRKVRRGEGVAEC